jgi:ketosteroid isomerase-like protein
MTTTETTFDVDALRRGIEGRDVAALLSLYGDDAELRIVDRASPPGNPRVLRGKQDVAAYLNDVCGRDMTHHLERVVVQGDTAAYLESCRYADGTRVLCSVVLDLAGGRIQRQVGVQAWDE